MGRGAATTNRVVGVGGAVDRGTYQIVQLEPGRERRLLRREATQSALLSAAFGRRLGLTFVGPPKPRLPRSMAAATMYGFYSGRFGRDVDTLSAFCSVAWGSRPTASPRPGPGWLAALIHRSVPMRGAAAHSSVDGTRCHGGGCEGHRTCRSVLRHTQSSTWRRWRAAGLFHFEV